jgi:2'-5' RNA ligase
MSFLGLCIPHETARLLSGIEVPGKREAVSSLHVTMFYFGEHLSIDRITEIIQATFGVVQDTEPFTVRTSLVSSFPKGDDGAPIICRVESDSLHSLRARIQAAYEDAGVDYANNYPEYTPHVTLSYAEEDGFEDKQIPVVEWGAHELVLWGGDSGDDVLVVTFPLALDDLGKTAKREASRVVRRYMEGF